MFKAPQTHSKRRNFQEGDCIDECEKPSQWCARKQEEALERGDTETAVHYFELNQLWKRREDQKCSG